MRIKSWLESVVNANYARPSRTRRRLIQKSQSKVEYQTLEDRRLLAYMFVDFGDMFPAGTLTTTQGAFRDVANDPVPGNRILGAQLVDGVGAFNAATPLNILRQSFTATARAQMMDVVARAYVPLDVTVVELTSSFQTTADGRSVRGAQNMTDVINTLRGGTASLKDAYIFVGTFNIGGANPATYGPGGGGNSPVSGLDTSDLSAAVNNHDDVAVVFSGGGFSTNTMNNISHEAGHNFGLQHAITNSVATASTNLFHQAEIMSYRNTNNTTSSIAFTRYPMIRGDGNTPGGGVLNNYNDIAARTGDLTLYDQLRTDGNVGQNPNYNFISGTGAHDIITVVKNGGNADVTVQAFADAAYTSAITVPSVGGTTYSFSIPLDKSILIYGGDSNDRFIIDSDLGVDVVIDGMNGTDTLRVTGKGAATATYTPNTTAPIGVDLIADYGGEISVNGNTITFNNFELSARVEIDDVTSAVLAGSSGGDNVTADLAEVTGTVSGTSFVPLYTTSVGNIGITTLGGNDTINVGTGNLDTINEPITVDGGGSISDTIIVNDSTATFSDTYTLTSTTLSRVVFPGLTYSGVGNLTLNAETGNNTINVNSGAAATGYTINANDGDDTVNLNGLDARYLVVNTQNGTTESVNVNGAVNVSGSVYISTPAFTMAAASVLSSTSSTVRVVADSMEINSTAAMNADGYVWLHNKTATSIDLGGADVPGTTLGLTDAEMDTISTPSALYIGDNISGNLTFSAPISHGNNLYLWLQGSTASITVNDSITMAPDKYLYFDAGIGSGITLATANADIATSGTGYVYMRSPRDISLTSGSSITTVDGSLTLSANQQFTPTSGTFVGVDVNAALVQATGTGVVTVLGRGGDTGSSQHGIQVVGGGDIIGGSTGTMTITGTGGNSTSGVNYGIRVSGSGSTITSGGSAISITGTGGGTGNFSYGLGMFGSGQIFTTGSASLTIDGTSSLTTSTGGYSLGVVIGSGTLIGTANGDLSVTGTGLGTSDRAAGIYLESAGVISSSGSGDVTLDGTGSATGGGSQNHGVWINGTSSVSSGSGAVEITATAGAGSTAFNMDGAGTTVTASGGTTIIADTVSMVNHGFFAGAVNFFTETPGQLIDVGGADVLGTTLGLTDAEIDGIDAAGPLNIGNSNSGAITVTSTITPLASLALTSGGGITINEAITMPASDSFSATTTGTAAGISLATVNADISTGFGNITLTSARNIFMISGSSVVLADGNLTLSANQQFTPTSGAFWGLELQGLIEATGTGAVTVDARGGDGAFSWGIYIPGSGQIIGGTGSPLAVTGTGGASSAGGTDGIQVYGTITANGADVSVTGYAGDGTASNSRGVDVGSGVISATGSGLLTIEGFGSAAGTGTTNEGVFFGSSATVFSGTGAININGTAGASSDAIVMANGMSVVSASSISLTGDADIRLSSVETTGVGQTVSVTSTAGSIVDNGDTATDIIGTNAVLSSLNGVGVGNPLETQVSNLEADGGSGGVFVANTGDLNIGGVGAFNGVSTNNADVIISAASDITVTEDILAGSGNVNLTATETITITVGATILTNGAGAIEITTPRNILVNSGATIETEDGGITLDANTEQTGYASVDIPKPIVGLTTVLSDLVIVDNGSIMDLNVTVDISHTWNDDLDVFLISPDGTRVELFTDVGGSSSDFTNTTLDDEATVDITAGSAPFTGVFRPEGNLSDFDGKSITGTWQLEVSDDVSVDDGTLNSWSLDITSNEGTTGNFGGIDVSSSTLRTAGEGDILLSGGGGNDAGSSFHFGVGLFGATVESTLAGASAGTITFMGGGGIGTNDNWGTDIFASTITTLDGDVDIVGVAGGTTSFNYGVIFNGVANLTSTGAADFTVYGKGGAGTNADVGIYAGTTTIDTGGLVEMAGVGGGGTFSPAIEVDSAASVSGNGIDLIGDDIAISGGAAISAPGGIVALRQFTDGTEIDLGTNTVGKLGLTSAELGAVSADTINIGDANSGEITISAPITTSPTTRMNLFTGLEINPTAAGTDVSIGSATLGSDSFTDLNIEINGTTVDTQYDQLNVAGQVDLTLLDLVITGSHVPTYGEQFVIVQNDGVDPIIGTFAGLPEGAILFNFMGSGLDATISYLGGTGNDVVISVLVDIDVLAPLTAVEGDTGTTNATFEIQLANVSATTVTVDFATTNFGYANPATPGDDYVHTTGTATFLPGQTSYFVDVPVNGDLYLEADEQFGLELSNNSGNGNIVNFVGDTTIVNDDTFGNNVIVDFGTPTSPVLGIGVGFGTEDYSAAIGMGWSSYVQLTSAEKTVGNDLARDIAQMRSGTFSVDVPNDTYDVQIYYGVVRRRDPFRITFESDPQITEFLTFGTNVSRIYTTTVSDGQLNMAFTGTPGLDPFARIAGFKINPVAAKGGGGEFGDKGGDDKGAFKGDFQQWTPPKMKLAATDTGSILAKGVGTRLGALEFKSLELAGEIAKSTENRLDSFFDAYAMETETDLSLVADNFDSEFELFN